MNNSINSAFNNRPQLALTQFNEAFWKSEPIEITFSQAVAANEEIGTALNKFIMTNIINHEPSNRSL